MFLKFNKKKSLTSCLYEDYINTDEIYEIRAVLKKNKIIATKILFKCGKTEIIKNIKPKDIICVLNIPTIDTKKIITLRDNKQETELKNNEFVVDVDGELFIVSEKGADQEKLLAIQKGIKRAKEEGINLIHIYGMVPFFIRGDYEKYGLKLRKERGDAISFMVL